MGEMGFTYGDKTIIPNETTFLLDGRLSDEQLLKNPYIFADVCKAFEAINANGGNITMYVAPYVYWIDDPDATDDVVCKEGFEVPFGIVVDCKALKIIGLSDNAYDAIIAGNRGQSHGSKGNYTMFYFRVNDLEFRDITFANYCSIDLVYPPMPQLNHEKRTSTITQAQIGMQKGDKLFAKNCNFVSRLNMMPVNGGKRCLYQNCHFESTDDALNGHAVYIDCDFEFYGNRPIYYTEESGPAFLNCTFKGLIIPESIERKQYFTKNSGPLTVMDSSYIRVSEEKADADLGIAWTKYPPASLKCYQSNVLYNDEPVIIAGEGAKETVCMDGKEVKRAYKINVDGNDIYNTYNLLCGDDDWDPLGVKELAQKANATKIPTLLSIEASATEMISGDDVIELNAKAFYYYAKECENADITFYIDKEDESYARLEPTNAGGCKLVGINEEDFAKEVIVHANTPQGLEAAVAIIVRPSLKEAPKFTKEPEILVQNGKASLLYEADFEGYEDHSLISWYRCKDAVGSGAIEVALTRHDKPLKEYELSKEDVGYYLMASIQTKHIRSREIAPVISIYNTPISLDMVNKAYEIDEDFENMPLTNRTEAIPGFFSLDQHRPVDTLEYAKWGIDENDTAFKYGATGNGSIGEGLYQAVQGARLRYTPVEGEYKDMSLRILADPAKTAGQGFGTAGQYMDICIKYDADTDSGYGLRILRSGEAANGVKLMLIEQKAGEVKFLTDGRLSSCYHTGLEIIVKLKGNVLSAYAKSSTINPDEAKYEAVVSIATELEAVNNFGGILIQHTGTPGIGGWQNTTMLHNLEIKWE